MSSQMSLESAIKTCSVNASWADKIQSSRFQNPNYQVCVPWNGLNSKGQQVCADSNQTKSAGCNSALDRVAVENELRPQWLSYVTLGAEGIQGDIYGNTTAFTNSMARSDYVQQLSETTPNFGKQFGADVDYTGCSVGAYERGMMQVTAAERSAGAMNNAATAGSMRYDSGMSGSCGN